MTPGAVACARTRPSRNCSTRTATKSRRRHRALARLVRAQTTPHSCSTWAFLLWTWVLAAITASIIPPTIRFIGWRALAILPFSIMSPRRKFGGTVALRIADAEGLPLDYTDYASQLREFVNETKTMALRRKLGDSYEAKALLDAVNDFAEEAAKIDKRRRSEVSEVDKSPSAGALTSLRRINDALIQTERALVDDRGLQGRTWYKHQIYAPGFYTGYAALPLPDLRQAIQDGRAAEANEAAARIISAIRRATEVLKQGRS